MAFVDEYTAPSAIGAGRRVTDRGTGQEKASTVMRLRETDERIGRGAHHGAARSDARQRTDGGNVRGHSGRPARLGDRPRPDAGLRRSPRRPRAADLGSGQLFITDVSPERSPRSTPSPRRRRSIPGFEFIAPGGAGRHRLHDRPSPSQPGRQSQTSFRTPTSRPGRLPGSRG